MNKLLTILPAIFILYGCNSNDGSKVNALTSTHKHDTEANALSLNQGKKWKSDSATRGNIQRLQTVSNQFANHELAEYKALAGSLQEALNKMMKECRMKGGDHDALHQWLEPFAKSVADLNEATEAEEARMLFRDIRDRLELYPKYFE